MAYKDEFEVARLMTAPEFAAELAQNFEGDFKVNYHLAPPLLSRRKDARGRPAKRRFGPWMGGAMRLLARMKGLRGRALNPFGHHAEARLHRDLLAWYKTALHRVAAAYKTDKNGDFLAILAAPDAIRGYGPVRIGAAAKARADTEAALKRLTG